MSPAAAQARGEEGVLIRRGRAGALHGEAEMRAQALAVARELGRG
jgi:hypothetical protein